jgi:argininosuccinate lyase
VEQKERFPAPAYAENVLAEIFEDAKRLFLDALIEVDIAHAVMLAERGIISREDACQILRALEGMNRDEILAARYDGSCEDLFFYLQQRLSEKCGEETAGRLHTARSRNDIDVTIYRMRLRRDLLALIRAVMDLRCALLDQAALHHETTIPAYTHTQPAQPTTLAHYLLAMAEVLSRDVARLQRAFENANLSPLGACAITTTGFDIDRARTAELLGFEGVAENSYAAISAVDYLTEAMGAVAVAMVNVGRFAQDFLLMATREFGFLRLSDGYVQISSIMPQKRNPVALEHVRALASCALAEAQGAFTVVHNTPFGDVNDAEDDLQPLIWRALHDARRATAVFAAAISHAQFDIERLRERAAEDFITVTELADAIVRREGLPFRVAHQIVASFVRRTQGVIATIQTSGESLHADLLAQAAHKLLQETAREILGRTLSLSPEETRRALDPLNFVRVRGVMGGPSPEETRRILQASRARAELDEGWYRKRTELMTTYPEKLREATRALGC